MKNESGCLSGIPLCEAVRWKGRDAVRLTNGIVELISLTYGGYLAVFRFVDPNEGPQENVLWEPPWTTIDPDMDWSREMTRLYGPPETGKYLAGFAGHALCLDYFGEPNAEQLAKGLSLHGEAASVRWRAIGCPDAEKPQCNWLANLPVSQLKFERGIRLGNHESVAYIEETVLNERDAEHHFDWVQHVTFGPPFISEKESTVFASAKCGVTSPFGYEGNSLLANDHAFCWPYASHCGDAGIVDLRVPFAQKGKGVLAGTLLDPERQYEFVLAANWKLGCGVGYCFRRDDFPWMTIWEENCARPYSPWNGSTQARGMEFGTKPLPISANDLAMRFPDASIGCSLTARGKRTARYIIFLFAVPEHMHSIEGVELSGDVISIRGGNGVVLSVPAAACEEFLAESSGC